MRVPRSLSVATGIGGLGLAAGGLGGPLLGSQLLGGPGGAGLPLGLVIAGSAATALPLAQRARQIGRLRALALGYALGATGAVLVIVAALLESVPALAVGSFALGGGNTAIFLTRYAAAETVGGEARARAIGAILLATAAGAIAGPLLLAPAGGVAAAAGLPRLSGLYLLAVVAYLTAALRLTRLARTLPLHTATSRNASAKRPRPLRGLLTGPLSLLRARRSSAALIILGVTNLLMVSIMAVAPVHLDHAGVSLDTVGLVIAAHVAAMFLPSPLSGRLTDRHGAMPVVAAGILLLVMSGAVGVLSDQRHAAAALAALVVLGLGWNLGVVGGSALLSSSAQPSARPQLEAVGEVTMGLGAMGGAPAAGLAITGIGIGGIWLIEAILAALLIGGLLSLATSRTR